MFYRFFSTKQNLSLFVSKKSERWSSHELQVLKEAVETHGKRWNIISKEFPDRSKSAVLLTYRRRILGINRVWSPWMSDVVKKGMENKQSIDKIHSNLKGIKSKGECLEKIKSFGTKPKFKKGKYSVEEDSILLKCANEGKSHKEISLLLGRNPNYFKKRILFLLEKQAKT
jgi:hypothetical protein